MKKSANRITAGIFLFLLLMGEPVYAGSLNANEQELMNIIRGTYTYEGVTYRVKDDYIRVAENYLLQDTVDCTDEQKQKALDEMFSSIQQGIDDGYLVEVKATEVLSSSVNGNMRVAGKQNTAPGEDGEEQKKPGTDLKKTDAEEAAVEETALEGTDAEETAAEETAAEETTALAPEILALEAFSEERDPEIEETEATMPELVEFPAEAVRGAFAGLSVCIAVISVIAARADLFFHRKKRRRGMEE